MRIVSVGKNEDGQRLDRVLFRYMDAAPHGFIYKMLRKKNITLNGKKAEGKERLKEGDEIRLFLSDGTIDGFSRQNLAGEEEFKGMGAAGRKAGGAACAAVPIVYEDDEVILFDKPAGMLSQKAKEGDFSLCEYLVDYLIKTGQTDEAALRTFRPSVCNRLDRNTSGLAAAGKSLAGLRGLNALFKSRGLHKYYRTVVCGKLDEKKRMDGFLVKDGRTNRVKVYRESVEGAVMIATEYLPLGTFEISGEKFTYLEINLITGRSHQIRAHLASVGHPVAGDPKYGDPGINRLLAARYGLKHQLLHSYRMEFPESDGAMKGLSGRTVTAPLPEEFRLIIPDDSLIV